MLEENYGKEKISEENQAQLSLQPIQDSQGEYTNKDQEDDVLVPPRPEKKEKEVKEKLSESERIAEELERMSEETRLPQPDLSFENTPFEITPQKFYTALSDNGFNDIVYTNDINPDDRRRMMLGMIANTQLTLLTNKRRKKSTIPLTVNLIGQEHNYVEDYKSAVYHASQAAVNEHGLMLEGDGDVHPNADAIGLIIAGTGCDCTVVEHELYTDIPPRKSSARHPDLPVRPRPQTLDRSERSWIMAMYVCNLLIEAPHRPITVIIGENHLAEIRSAVIEILTYVDHPYMPIFKEVASLSDTPIAEPKNFSANELGAYKDLWLNQIEKFKNNKEKQHVEQASEVDMLIQCQKECCRLILEGQSGNPNLIHKICTQIQIFLSKSCNMQEILNFAGLVGSLTGSPSDRLNLFIRSVPGTSVDMLMLQLTNMNMHTTSPSHCLQSFFNESSGADIDEKSEPVIPISFDQLVGTLSKSEKKDLDFFIKYIKEQGVEEDALQKAVMSLPSEDLIGGIGNARKIMELINTAVENIASETYVL